MKLLVRLAAIWVAIAWLLACIVMIPLALVLTLLLYLVHPPCHCHTHRWSRRR